MEEDEEEKARSNRSTVAWVSAIAGLLGAIAAVIALFIGGGGGDGDGGNGPQYDPSRAEQEAAMQASASARSQGINFSADDFAVSCEPSGSGGDTQIWNCTADSGQCAGSIVIALDSSGLASLRQNSVGCGE